MLSLYMFCHLWFVDGILQCILLCFLMAHFLYVKFHLYNFWNLFVPLDKERDCESELSCQQSCMVGSCITYNAFLNISSWVFIQNESDMIFSFLFNQIQ